MNILRVLVLGLLVLSCSNRFILNGTEDGGYTLLNVQNFLNRYTKYYKVQFYTTDKIALSKEFDLKVPNKDFEINSKGKILLEKSTHVKKSFIGRNTPLIIRKSSESNVLKGILYASKLPVLAKDVYDKIIKRGLIRVFFEKNTYILYTTFRPLYPNDFMADVFQEDQFIDFYTPFRVSPLAINFEENKLASQDCRFYLIVGNTQTKKEELHCTNQMKIEHDHWNRLKYRATLKTEKTTERSYYKGVPIQNN